MASDIIEVEQLVKLYGDNRAVDSISFTVPEGEFFGFLGPNGAGKTTTMRMLATLLRPTSGTVRISGIDALAKPNDVRRVIGFAMQEISLDNMASAYENLQLLGVLYGLSPAAARKRAGELIEMVGLTKVADKWVNSYSGGMRRRLDLAGTLMHSPKLLFLDEPTQGLDPHARRIIWDYLRELNKQGTTMFLTTHYMDEADVLCRDLAVIDHGKLILRGAPNALKDNLGGDMLSLQFGPNTDLDAVESTIRSLTGDRADVRQVGDSIIVTARGAAELTPPLIEALNQSGRAPISLHLTQPSLEDLFVKLVGRSLADDTQLVHGIDPFVQGRM